MVNATRREHFRFACRWYFDGVGKSQRRTPLDFFERDDLKTEPRVAHSGLKLVAFFLKDVDWSAGRPRLLYRRKAIKELFALTRSLQARTPSAPIGYFPHYFSKMRKP